MTEMDEKKDDAKLKGIKKKGGESGLVDANSLRT